MPMSEPGILLFVAAMPPPTHGQSVITMAIYKELVARGISISLVDTSPGSLVRSIRYHLKRIGGIANAFRKAYRLRRSPGRKVVYTIVESGAGVFYNIVLAVWFRILGYEAFFHHHTAANTLRFRPVVGVFLALAGPNSTQIVLSAQMAEDLRARYCFRGKIEICHNAALVSGSPSEDRASKRSVCVGHLSNLSREKGTIVVLETLQRGLAAKVVGKLILAGPASDPEIVSAIEVSATQLPNAVHYLGAISGERKEEFFLGIDVFIFPTMYPNEAQPLVVLEALARGVPVVAYDRGYLAELLGPAGHIVDRSADFAEEAVAQIARWAEEDLSAASVDARRRYEVLADDARRGWQRLVALLDPAYVEAQ